MRTSVSTYAVIGVKFDLEDFKIVDSPAKYELEARYDIRTGERIVDEVVLVKEEKSHYILFGKRFEDIYDIEDSFSELGLTFYYTNFYGIKTYYIGLSVTISTTLGNFIFPEGSVDFEQLSWKFREVSEKLNIPSREIKMHFFYEYG